MGLINGQQYQRKKEIKIDKLNYLKVVLYYNINLRYKSYSFCTLLVWKTP